MLRRQEIEKKEQKTDRRYARIVRAVCVCVCVFSFSTILFCRSFARLHTSSDRVNIVTFFRSAFFALLTRNRRRFVGRIFLCFQPADRLATSSPEALHARRHDERVIDR